MTCRNRDASGDGSRQKNCPKFRPCAAPATCRCWIWSTAFSIHLATSTSTPTAKVSQKHAATTTHFTGLRNRNIQKNKNRLDAVEKWGSRASTSVELYCRTGVASGSIGLPSAGLLSGDAGRKTAFPSPARTPRVILVLTVLANCKAK